MTPPAYLSAAVPRGLGMWVLEISAKVMGTPQEAARRARDHGLDFVILAACWQDGPGKHADMNARDLDAYGAAFRAAGVLPWVWGYPWGDDDMIPRFVERMRAAADAAGAVGIVLDPELGFRGRPAQMRALLERTLDSLDEQLGLGVSSYGQPSGMRDFPWSVAGGYGWGSPQCYRAKLAQARAGLDQWRAFGWRDLVVSLPTFGPNAEDGARLTAYASALLEHTGGAGCFWQWGTTSPAEWDVIAMLAQRDDIEATPPSQGAQT